MSGAPSAGDGDGYEPSPYPVSILPRVRHGKTRPKIETVDVPPSPLEISEETVQEDLLAGRGSQGDDEEHLNDEDAICTPSSPAIAEVPGSTRRRRRGKDTASSAPSTQPKAKIVEVIGEDNSNPDVAKSSSNCGQDHACATCNNNVARYTCPKCGAPYCSVACYKIHDGTSTDPGKGKVCTESFYKDRVLGMYGKGEDGDKLRGILGRMYRDINANLDDAERREESLSGMLQEGSVPESITSGMRSEIKDNVQSSQSSQSSVLTVAANSPEILSDEDLAELADYVLQMDDADDDGPGNREILESIPPHLLHAFECALAAADEASDSAVETEARGRDEMRNQKDCRKTATKKYTLWWLPGEADSSENDELQISNEPTLDERILSLHPLPKARSSSDVPLSYNILEVLYAAAFAIRIKCNAFAGSRDAAEIDEAALLLSQSLVLSQDARYDSVRGAMMACSERLVENKKRLPMSALKPDGSVMTWDALALDVATLSFHRRQVLRMLFDALDICQLGVNGIKSQLKQIRAKRHGEGGSAQDMERAKRELEETKRKYKLASKKVEYFLSWCSSVWTPQMGQELSEEVRAYVADWKLEVQTKESSVEKLIRGIHSGGDDDSAGLQMGGLFDIGGSQPTSSLVGEEMVSISTVRKT
ncbi:hypothetical protein ACHAXT_010889 [Thalassiosira profunda]